MNVQDIAEQASHSFETATRSDGETFDRLRNDRPEWVYEAVRNAHDGMLPDDFVYRVCREAFEFIGENEDAEDMRGEFEDGVDVYTSELVAWLASNTVRMQLCDEAEQEFGPYQTMDARIMGGQYMERSQIFEKILAAVEAQASEVEAA